MPVSFYGWSFLIPVFDKLQLWDSSLSLIWGVLLGCYLYISDHYSGIQDYVGIPSTDCYKTIFFGNKFSL